MVVDEDLLRPGVAFYARRIMQPSAVPGAIHWLPGAALFQPRLLRRALARRRRQSPFNFAKLGGLTSSGSCVPNKIVHTSLAVPGGNLAGIGRCHSPDSSENSLISPGGVDRTFYLAFPSLRFSNDEMRVKPKRRRRLSFASRV